MQTIPVRENDLSPRVYLRGGTVHRRVQCEKRGPLFHYEARCNRYF
jgi:hypothetical protein